MFKRVLAKTNNMLKSVWLFPVVVMMIFVIFVALGINGSSIGVYNDILGKSQKDPNLIIGEPRPIRSDEWIVMSQMILSQSNESFPSFNTSIGDGQNMNVVLDVPTVDWSQIFRPQNHAFFVLPFENAFSYRWWFMSAALLIVVYFLALHFIPGRRLVASAIAASTLFSGFLQWWYQISTLGSFMYGFLTILLVINLIRSKHVLHRIIYSVLLTYVLIAFAIILYPPFQIPISIVMLSFIIGLTIKLYKQKRLMTSFKQLWPYLTAIILATASTIALFLWQNRDTISLVQNTSYPGKRIVESGGYSIEHLLSGNLAVQQLRTDRASAYKYDNAPVQNQSESSTFIFTSFFLIPLLLVVNKKQRRSILTPTSVALLVCLSALLAWMFIPNLGFIGEITKLNMVPHNRLVIGLGFLNILLLMQFIGIMIKNGIKLNRKKAAIYSALCFILLAVLHTYIHLKAPGFIGMTLAIALAIPIPIIVWLLLRERATWALVALAAFSALGAGLVNPIYKGVDILSDNQISRAIKSYPDDKSIWVSEGFLLENVVIANGRESLSGVYVYPQKELWKFIDNGTHVDKYNRYAHVIFYIDKDAKTTIPTTADNTSPDQFVIRTEACSNFMKESGVKYILSPGGLDATDQSCIISSRDIFTSRAGTIYKIYTTNFDSH